jgi:hypothetical protein
MDQCNRCSCDNEEKKSFFFLNSCTKGKVHEENDFEKNEFNGANDVKSEIVYETTDGSWN